MKGHGSNFPRKQDEAIAALLTVPTVSAAARRIKVSETTLWRWLQEPQFQRAYRAARRQVVEAAIGRLQQACGDAVTALRRNLTGRGAVSVSAARAILGQAIEAIEIMDLAERVEALEQQSRSVGVGHGASPQS